MCQTAKYYPDSKRFVVYQVKFKIVSVGVCYLNKSEMNSQAGDHYGFMINHLSVAEENRVTGIAFNRSDILRKKERKNQQVERSDIMKIPSSAEVGQSQFTVEQIVACIVKLHLQLSDKDGLASKKSLVVDAPLLQEKNSRFKIGKLLNKTSNKDPRRMEAEDRI